MIVTTSYNIEGKAISDYLGIASGEVIYGANVFRDIFAGVRDVIGGRSKSYENVVRDGREAALADLVENANALGADAIIGVDIDFQTVGKNGTMLMVAATGTAVKTR
ncbi:MAG: hypothetical protein CMM48_07240 [Rhodospirillaceae bacterium]|nr:hypothetical protein [Rhodospirillaceae bacterium]HAA92979.1 hypothetical protein [Rhodospirillaceae bacterium]|tara:strand:- start:269 stop:589 length:321 start_codon:yes stop_codon:yes gene_type:complete